MQNGAQENIWLGITAISSCCAVYVAKNENFGIIGYAILMSFAPNFCSDYGATAFLIFFIERGIKINSFWCFSYSIASEIVRRGGVFLILQIAAAVQGQMDNVIIANMLGPAAVTQYSVCMKLFLMPMAFYGLILNPMWPAYRDALASKDYIWIQRSFAKTMKIGIVFGFICSIILIACSGIFIEKWIGDKQIPDYQLRIGCGIWFFLSVIGSTMATFLNGMELMRPQLKIAVVTTIANIGITIALIPVIGVSGAVFGSAVAYLVFALVPSYFLIKNRLKSFEV